MEPDPLATSFAGVAAEYERGRPGYPPRALDRLAAELGLDRGSTVVDLAAGTGKLTRELVGRFRRVIAIEPLAEMLGELARALRAAEAIAGSAEEMPLPDACADAVLVAQAFHWFDGRRALAEIARVLRPAGGLGLVWNLSPWERRVDAFWTDVDRLLDERCGRRPDSHAQRTHEWKSAFGRENSFAPLETARFRHEQRLGRADFIAALASRSYVAALPAGKREGLLADVAGMLERDDAPLDGGEVVMPLQTDAYWARLRRGG